MSVAHGFFNQRNAPLLLKKGVFRCCENVTSGAARVGTAPLTRYRICSRSASRNLIRRPRGYRLGRLYPPPQEQLSL